MRILNFRKKFPLAFFADLAYTNCVPIGIKNVCSLLGMRLISGRDKNVY